MNKNVFRILTSIALQLALCSVAVLPVFAADVNFSGQLTLVQTDTGGGVYSGASAGTDFFGAVDDATFDGFISDGTTHTPFGCCIAAGGLSVENDVVLTFLEAFVLNSVAGTNFSSGDMIDGINIEGDAVTAGGGRMEIGLSLVMDPLAFNDTGLDNYPPDPNDVVAALFFIYEEDSQGQDVYSAAGVIDSLPFTDTVLLRRMSDNRWTSYTISFDDVAVTTHDRGAVDLTRNAAYETVSRSDFDADGNADLLIRDTNGSENRRWRLATLLGSTVTSDGIVNLSRNPDWDFVAAEDFDGDGRTDVLLRNVLDGRWQMNLLNVQTVLSKAVLPMTTDLTDTLVGAEDFDGDGVTDLLLRRADGSWLMYLMNGVNAPIEELPLMTTDIAVTVQTLADFNGDGSTDVLLRRPNGRWLFYLLDGDMILGSGPLPLKRSFNFSVVSSADFSGDGNADILLRRADGRWYLYALDGLAILTEGWLTDMTRNPDYGIVSDQDISNDRMADLFLRRTDGRWILYSIDGTVPAVIAKGNPGMTRNPDWVPQTD